MAENNWEEGVVNLEALASQFKDIERKALRSVLAAIKPRAVEVTPVHVSKEQSGDSLQPGQLRTSVRGRVVQATADAPSAAIVDWGRNSYIANIVDIGHRAPHARALTRAGHKVAGKPTPPHPFVRAVQDSTQAQAQEAYETAMKAEIEKVLQGA